MQRRDFLLTSAATASVAACGLTVADDSGVATFDGSDAETQQLIEWRTYRLSDASRQPLIHEYLEKACLPAWQRLGVAPVGAFTEIGPDAGPSVHVLLTYTSLVFFANERTNLERDAQYQQAAANYFAAKMSDPAFDRIESTLMITFSGAPKITPPAQKPRVLELRTYESHSEERARKKIDMFNNGEIPIFPKCGFENVFFGESLIGPGLPNLKYMLAAPDMAANEAGWKKFIADPEFTAMKNDPQYADTVSKITKLFLQPTPYSQI